LEIADRSTECADTGGEGFSLGSWTSADRLEGISKLELLDEMVAIEEEAAASASAPATNSCGITEATEEAETIEGIL
jgi:hypothetical protein